MDLGAKQAFVQRELIDNQLNLLCQSLYLNQHFKVQVVLRGPVLNLAANVLKDLILVSVVCVL